MGFRDWAWRYGQQGRAWQAYELGGTRYKTALDVTTADYRQTIAAIEDAGWCFEERVDHSPIRTTTVNPKPDGGHEVIKATKQQATFYFTRAESARIAPEVEAARRQRRERPQRDGETPEESAMAPRKIRKYLGARSHRYRVLAASVLLVPGLILMTLFFTYTKKTTESGHLWWKKTTTANVTVGEKLPLLIIGLLLLGAATLFAASALRRVRLQNANVAAVANARSLRHRRAAAREFAKRDPQMARDLRIGRPDLPGEYDDGGLIDVNIAPAEVLVVYLGLDRTDAAQIANARKDVGRFESDAELVTLAGLDPTALDQIRGRIILL